MYLFNIDVQNCPEILYVGFLPGPENLMASTFVQNRAPAATKGRTELTGHLIWISRRDWFLSESESHSFWWGRHHTR